MKKLITAVSMVLVIGSAYAQQSRCNPPPRQCQPNYRSCPPPPRQCYPSRSHHSGGLSIGIGVGGLYVGVGNGGGYYNNYPRQYPQHQQRVVVVPAPQYQQQVVVEQAPQQYYDQVQYQPQVQRQQVFVQQSPVYVASAPQVEGLLPPRPQQPRTMQIDQYTPIVRTTTTWHSSSSGGSTIIERFER